MSTQANMQAEAPDLAAVRPPRAGRNRLAPPVQLTPLIERDLVLRSLDVARAGRLTQLIGPPGSGKTTVLAQWRRRLLAMGVAVAWYTASEREREPRAFLHMLARALDAAGLDMASTGLLDTPDADPAAALDAILLKLETAAVELVLVVDEYDRVETAPVAAIIEALIETAPETTHLVIGARRRPSLAVSVLRAQGVVRTIDAGELRFSREELANLLHLPEEAPDLEVIAERTEGWPVAVELYRLWRRRRGGDDSLSALFSGQVAEVADYLTEQVFATLEPAQQALLTDLCVFSYIEPDLSDHVRQRSDSAGLLRSVDAALPGLVEHGLSEAEPVYRFHPLLIDYARSRAEMATGDANGRRLRAAAWFERRGRYVEALQQLQAAADSAALAGLMRRIRPLHVFLAQGASELRAILRECPPDLLSAHPRLQLMAALAHFKSGFFIEAAAMLEAVKARTADFASEPFGDTAALQMEGRALELLFSAYVEGAETRAEPWVEALAAVSTDEPLMWAWSENIMIVIHEERGDLAASREAIARTRAIYRTHGMLRYADMSLINHDLLLALAQGQMRQAADLAAVSRRVQLGELSSDVPVIAMARIAQAAVEYERRYVEAAADAARQGLEQFGEAETWGEPYAIAHEVIADVAWRRGGITGVRRFIEEARLRVRRIGVRSADRFLGALLAGYLARAGELQEAEPLMLELLERRARWAAGAPCAWRERDAAAVSLARWRLARGERAEAAAVADELTAEAESGGRMRSAAKGLVLAALARTEDAGKTRLERALEFAQPEGLVAVFAEEGEALLPLIEAIAVEESSPPPLRRHAESVLRALNLGRRAPNALNEREAQIVAHLAEGASNKLIARRLGLTENTIKFHLKKVFAKLGVTSRKAAAAAVRDLAD
jgi:LuxR family maltose regulon positive regulatory protein